jgi:hypothetical protein
MFLVKKSQKIYSCLRKTKSKQLLIVLEIIAKIGFKARVSPISLFS